MSNDHPYTHLDFNENYLYAHAPVEAGAKLPYLRLMFAPKDNSIDFRVYTRAPSDAGNNNGQINFIVPLPKFLAILAYIRLLAEGKAEGPTTWQYKSTFVAGQRRDPAMLVSTLTVSKGEDGVIFVGIRSAQESRPAIKFIFGPKDPDEIFFGKDKKKDVANASVLYALGFAGFWQEFGVEKAKEAFNPGAFGVALRPDDRARFQKPKKGGNGGGNYNGNNGGGNNYRGNKGNSGGNQGSSDSYGNSGFDDTEDFDDGF